MTCCGGPKQNLRHHETYNLTCITYHSGCGRLRRVRPESFRRANCAEPEQPREWNDNYNHHRFQSGKDYHQLHRAQR